MTVIVRATALGLTCLLSSTVVLADDSLPHRKPGLWEVTMQMPDMPSMPGGGGGLKSSECIDCAQ